MLSKLFIIIAVIICFASSSPVPQQPMNPNMSPIGNNQPSQMNMQNPQMMNNPNPQMMNNQNYQQEARRFQMFVQGFRYFSNLIQGRNSNSNRNPAGNPNPNLQGAGGSKPSQSINSPNPTSNYDSKGNKNYGGAKDSTPTEPPNPMGGAQKSSDVVTEKFSKSYITSMMKKTRVRYTTIVLSGAEAANYKDY